MHLLGSAFKETSTSSYKKSVPCKHGFLSSLCIFGKEANAVLCMTRCMVSSYIDVFTNFKSLAISDDIRNSSYVLGPSINRYFVLWDLKLAWSLPEFQNLQMHHFRPHGHYDDVLWCSQRPWRLPCRQLLRPLAHQMDQSPQPLMVS